jgi:peptidoglycan hydrolase-like protein with peptidoglycan-binding domain
LPASAEDMPQYDMAPNVPGVVDDHDNRSTMSRDDVRQLEQTLADAGYDPGAMDWVVDDQTQAAISEFQADHALVAIGIVDAETGELLGIVIHRSS